MKYHLAVSAYIVHNHRILLVKHRRLGKVLPPGGKVLSDETPDDAINREIKEELGLEIELLDMNSLDVPYPSEVRLLTQPLCVQDEYISDSVRHLDLVYVAKAASSRLNIARDELLDAQWYEAAELETQVAPSNVKALAAIALDYATTD